MRYEKILALVVMLLVSLLTSCDMVASNENNDGDAQHTDSNAQRVITVVAPKSPATIPVLAMIENQYMGSNCMVARSAYLSGNEELVQEFNEKFSEAIEWMIDHPTDADTLASEHINGNSELMAEAMPSFCFDYNKIRWKSK